MSEVTLGEIRNDSFIEKLVKSKVFWVLFTFLMFSYPIARSVFRKLPPPLPVYSNLGDYELTNEFGKPFGSKDLKGRLYIANFMFTSCPTTCPGLMEKMQLIQKRVRGLGQNVALVTFTVDPETDTPQVLHKFARKLHANPHVWSFLSGSEKQLRDVLVDRFKVPMGEYVEIDKKLNNEDITLYDIAHTEKVVLVDRDNNIRGYYSTDKNSMNKLMIDLGLLANRKAF